MDESRGSVLASPSAAVVDEEDESVLILKALELSMREPEIVTSSSSMQQVNVADSGDEDIDEVLIL